MPNYLSNRLKNLKIGISSYSENKTSLEVTGGVGIGTTNSNGKSLYAVGNIEITGITTLASAGGITTTGGDLYVGGGLDVIGGTNLDQLQVTGISTFTNGPVFVGSGTSTGTASQTLQVTGGAYVSGNLGIGTTNPQTKLEISGIIGFITSRSSTSYGNNIRIGDKDTGPNITPHSPNFFSGINNIFIGIGAGKSTTRASSNIAIGQNAFAKSYFSNASNNVVIGDNAGVDLRDSDNVIIGPGAGLSFYNQSSIAIGVDAGKYSTGNQSNNIFIGPFAGRYVTGRHNSIFGSYAAGFGNFTGQTNSFFGRLSGQVHTTGSYNNFFGAYSGTNNTTGSYNSFFGNNSGNNNTVGSYNIFFGSYTGISESASNKVILGSGKQFNQLFDSPDTTKDTQFAVGVRTDANPSKYWLVGNENFNIGIGTTNPTTKLQVGGVLGFGPGDNVRIGDNTTGANLTTGYSNIFIGVGAGNSVTTGRFSNFFGNYAGYYATGGEHNNFFGFSAGYNNTTGRQNNFFGFSAGYNNTFGRYNNFFGRDAGFSNTGGYNNNFFGRYAGLQNTTGDDNNFIGRSAGYNNTTGNDNTFIGRAAGFYNTTGQKNNFFGSNAGTNNKTGNNNNFFGNYTGIHTNTSFRVVMGQGYAYNDTFDVPKNADIQFAVGVKTDANPSKYWLVGNENFNIGIGTTNPTSKLTVTGDVLVSGVSTFIGAITGTISTATKLETARTFEITGDIVASPITFDGTGNVSLAATIQPNSVGLGTDTFGDYVESISGTIGEIDVTGGTGEGSTPVISFAPNPTIGGNVTIGNDLQVNNNLNVIGNITVGGTSAYIIVEDFRVTDADITLGFTTDVYGNDVSTDTTANHGGIAVASTEGNPLVQLVNVAIGETLPATYKKFMWFKAGSFAGLNTDSWLSNYAIGIGSTQFPSGTRLAAGSVQITENDLAVVRNINASGIGTISTLDTTNGTIDYLSNTHLTSGIGTIETLDTTNGTIDYLSNTHLTSGIGTIETLDTTNGTIDYLEGTNVSYSGIGTINSLNSEFLNVSGISSFVAISVGGTTGQNQYVLTSTGIGVTWQSIASIEGTAGVNVALADYNEINFIPFSRVSTGTTSTLFVDQDLKFVYNSFNGNIGIGTTNPTTKLQVGSVFDRQVIGFGTVQGYLYPGTNILIGDSQTGSSLTPQVGGAWKGLDNNFIGAGAGNSTTTGSGNNFFGLHAGYSNTSGYYNNFFGLYAGQSNTTGNNNNFFGGYSTGVNNTTGSNNNFLGNYAGRNNTTGSRNNFIGDEVGSNNTVGYDNNFIGKESGYYNTNGDNNNFIGKRSGYFNTSGAYNNFFGSYAGLNNTTGRDNSFIGRLSGSNNTTGRYNVAFGKLAGFGNQTGSFNVFLGSYTGVSTSASRKVIIGNGTNTQRFDAPDTNKDVQFAVGIKTTAVGEYWLVGNENFNIGIGVTNPTSKLTVGGDVIISGVTTTGLLNVGVGGTIITTTGIGSVGIGTTNPQTKLEINGVLGFGPDSNVRIGDKTTGEKLTTGYNNNFMGVGAGNSTTTGHTNNFFGYYAGYFNTTGNQNNFFGEYAGYNNTGGGLNNFFGTKAGYYNTTGNQNNFFGYRAGYFNTTGDYNIFFGERAGFNNVGGSNNIFFGKSSGFYTTQGFYNIFFGLQSGALNTTGSYNNIYGAYAGYNNTTGSNNNFFGKYAGCGNTTGNNNVFLGSYTGISTSASKKVILGVGYNYNTPFDSPDTTKDNQLAIGLRNSTGPSQYWLVGNENFNIGIGTTNPTTKLQVGGVIGFNDSNVRIGDNTTGANLTSGVNNIFMGVGAGNSTTNPFGNIFIGDAAGRENTIGNANVFIGSYSGRVNTEGNYNIIFGLNAGLYNTLGSSNNFVGYNAGYSNVSGNYNNFFGAYTGISATASNKVIIGRGSDFSTGLFDAPDTTKDTQFAVGVRTDSNPSKYWLVGNENFNIGIGTTNPTTKLQVGGVLGFGQGNNIKIGDNTTGANLTTGYSNIFMGVGAGNSTTTGCYNNFFGSSAGFCNTTGRYNNFFGNFAGFHNTSGQHNNFIGEQSGYYNTVGTDNNFFGDNAGFYQTAGYNNNFLSKYSGFRNTTGRDNNFLGYYAGGENTTGSYNNFLGNGAGKYSNTGSHNIAVGTRAGEEEYDGNYNIFLGSYTGVSNFSTPTTNKIIIGRGTSSNRFDGPTPTKSTQFAVGIRTDANPSKYWLVGNENFNVGIGTTNPTSKLTVGGDATITGNLSVSGVSTFSSIRIINNLYDNNNSDGGNLQVLTSTGAGVSWSDLVLIPAGNAASLDGLDSEDFLRSNVDDTKTGVTTFADSVVIGIGRTVAFFDVNTGNLGIGTTNPQTKLEINGILGFSNTYSDPLGRINVRIGDKTTGEKLTTGYSNNFMGVGAGNSTTSGHINNFFGYKAGYFNTTGNQNNFFGNYAGYNNTEGGLNNFFGTEAGYYNTTGNQNNFFGYRAGFYNTTGRYNIFFGERAGFNNVGGSSNIFFGKSSGFYTTQGYYNIFFGLQSGALNTTGSYNNIYGAYAGYNNTTGTNNNFFGKYAGGGNKTGNYNNFFGTYTGISTSASRKVILGVGVWNGIFDAPDTTKDLQFAVGVRTDANPSKYWLVGNENFNIGIGTTNPTSKLTVTGDVFVSGIITSTDYNSASDINLKTDITKIENPLEKITRLNGVSFTWKANNRKSLGVIAQEVEAVLPELVSGTDPKTVNYNGLIGLLIECVKEQQKEIDDLKKRLSK